MNIFALLLFVGVGGLVIGGFYYVLGSHPTEDPKVAKLARVHRRMAPYFLVLGGASALVGVIGVASNQ